MDNDIYRLMTSRKIWGAILASASIITAGRIIADPAVATQAIIQLGILWLAAIGGQAAKDYIEKRRDNTENK
jgi:arginine exporter protein ArgO